MAQHDMNIANQGFPATRADINNALQAIATNNSGTSAPSTTFANQWFYDTTNNKLFIRNEANNAFIQVAVLDQTANEWQITTGQISASDGDGLVFKTDDGNTRITLSDGGDVTFAEGTDVLTATAGTDNIRIGENAGDSIASGGIANVVIGKDAGTAISTGDNNTAVGHQAGSTLSTGGANVFIGQAAGLNTIGTNNTFLGVNSGDLVTSGNKNTILGRFNGNQSGHDIRTSDNQIVLSDGDGNPRFMFHSFWQTDGHAISTIQTDLVMNTGVSTDITVPHGTYILTLKMIVAGTGQVMSAYATGSWFHTSTVYMDVIELGTDGGGLTASTNTATSGNMKVRVNNNTGFSGHTIKVAFLRIE